MIPDLSDSMVKKKEFNLKKLDGKHILLISLSGYCEGILKKMRDLGADVDYMNDKPNDGFICKTLGRYQAGFYQTVLHNYYKACLEVLKNQKYDFILSIRGEYTPVRTLKLLKSYYPDSKLILYMWDGLGKQNTKGIEEKWPYYDKVYTFDRIDYEMHKESVSFLPLYFYEDYLPKNVPDSDDRKYKYNLSFVGTGHDDRIRIVKNIMKQCEKQGLRCFSYFFMPHPAVFLKYKIMDKNFRHVHMNDVSFKMMPLDRLYNLYADSQCVIDVENAGQHGLTMRSIEILGLRRKLITTNKDIKNYDFYHENNILIIDRNNPVIDMDFFKKPYRMLNQDIYKKYCLENWILQVLK